MPTLFPLPHRQGETVTRYNILQQRPGKPASTKGEREGKKGAAAKAAEAKAARGVGGDGIF